MLRTAFWSGLLALAFATGSVDAHPPRPEETERPPVPGMTYSLDELAPGVYAAVAEGVPYYVSNSVVIVGDDGVLLVDSGAGPNEARVLRAAIRTITDLPVRYIVDTHFHFDHALGHAAFPEAVSIGHVATRAGLALGRQQATFAGNLQGMPQRAEELRAEARVEADAAKRAEILGRADAVDAYRLELEHLVPDPPRITFESELTVWLGEREVRILHLGRGHTAGDTVVYLPNERLICTGDLFNGYIGFMGDAYVDEWAETLGRLSQLDFAIVVAGHGKPFEGKDAIAPVQACLRDLWQQAEALEREGMTTADAAARIDLTAHAQRFPALAKPGYNPLAIERIFAVIDERAAGTGRK